MAKCPCLSAIESYQSKTSIRNVENEMVPYRARLVWKLQSLASFSSQHLLEILQSDSLLENSHSKMFSLLVGEVFVLLHSRIYFRIL